MLQGNPLLAQLKQQFNSQKPKVEGVVKAHPKGFGFLEIDPKTSYFIPPKSMNQLLDGDKVKGSVEHQNGKDFFVPETLIETSLTLFIAKVQLKDQKIFLVPEKNSSLEIEAENSVNIAITENCWVQAKLTQHPFPNGKALANIEQLIANEDDKNLIWLKALVRNQLPTQDPSFSIDSLSDIEAAERIDLRAMPFFTIDNASTQDMDDAIAIQKRSDGSYLLSVAIADPSAFIEENSELDREAKRRLFTTYLPNYHISMLPLSLAYELCSLKSNVDRPALVVHTEINPDGEINYSSIRIESALINSKAKLSYDEVSDFIESQKLGEIPETLHQALIELSEFSLCRYQYRKDHALVFTDRIEYDFIFNEENEVIDIQSSLSRIANSMVEESMLVANLAVAYELKNRIGSGIFNIHCEIENKFIDQILTLLHEHGFTQFNQENLSTLEGYLTLRRLTDEHDDLLAYRLRRLLSPSTYSFEPKAHFSLGFDVYATWTSPIRKYSDLVNHRIIKSSLFNRPKVQLDNALLNELSDKRKANRFAEREVNEVLYAQYLAKQMETIYQAEIIDINKGGMRVKFTENGAVAFIPSSLLHPNRSEIEIQPEKGIILINNEPAFKLLGQVQAKVNEIKPNCSVIAEVVA